MSSQLLPATPRTQEAGKQIMHFQVLAKNMRKYLAECRKLYNFAPRLNKYTQMKVKNNRLETLRMIISSQEMGSQEELDRKSVV